MSIPSALPVSGFAVLQGHWRNRASFAFLDLDFDDGRGLLELAAALLDDPEAPACLHYFAIAPGWDMAALAARALAMLEAAAGGPFACFAEQLARAWTPVVPGFQRLILAGGRLVLTLASGTPAVNLPQLDLAFDAAFCRSADATPNAIRWLGRLAAADALLLLGGPAGDAHADFLKAGFAEEERVSDGETDIRLLRFTRRIASRSAPRHSAFRLSPPAEKHAIVIGAGLAGAAACHRLAARGWRCTLIEQYGSPAQQASGNAAGIFMPVLSQDDNPLSRLSRAAFLFALHLWDGLGGVGAGLDGQACGVLQLPRSDAPADAGRALPAALPPQFARRLSGMEATHALGQRVGGGWWFEKAGWLRPAAVCEAMLQACGDRLLALYGRQAARLQEADGVWQVLDAAGSAIAQAPTVILCNGTEATRLAQAADLPLRAIRGQVTHLPASAADVPFVVCGDAYLTPPSARAGIASLGASYDQDADPALRTASHLQNIRHLRRMLPDWMPPADPEALDGRVGFRCVTADRLPLAGALPDLAHNDGHAGKQPERLEDMPRLAGLHGLLGYGSRGLIWAPLMAELLAARLNGEPAPLPRDLTALLDPARFALKRHRRHPQE